MFGEEGGNAPDLRAFAVFYFLEQLWQRGVLPDYRRPDGIRIGPAPLSTSFTELYRGMSVLRDLVAALPA